MADQEKSGSKASEWATKKREVDKAQPKFVFAAVGENNYRTLAVGPEGSLYLDGQFFMSAEELPNFFSWMKDTYAGSDGEVKPAPGRSEPIPNPTEPGTGGSGKL